MKRIFLATSFFVLTVTSGLYASDDLSSSCFESCSRSFLRHRPLSQDNSIEYALNKSFMHWAQSESEKEIWLTWNWTNLISQSNNGNDLRQYFFPCNKNCLSIVQPTSIVTDTGDISSPWIRLVGDPAAPFSSIMSISPKRSVFASIFDFHMEFEKWCRSFWMGLLLPVVYVKHDLNFCEQDITGVGTFGTIKNAFDAFNSNALCCGKLPCKKQTKWGVDDIKLTLGWNFYKCPNKIAGFYINMFAPTHKGSRPCNLFEPTIGSGGHVGLGAGLNGDWMVCDNDTTQVNVMVDARYAYFFKNDEIRSFDLCSNGEWSRYTMLATSSGDCTCGFPTICCSSLTVDVTPRSSFEVLGLMHMRKENVSFELGYDFWWRQEEKITIDCCTCFCEDVSILDIPGAINNISLLTSASTAQICESYNSTLHDTTRQLVDICDLNLASGAQARSMTSKIWGGISYDTNNATMVGVGMSYEFAHKISSIEQWVLWFKTAISF